MYKWVILSLSLLVANLEAHWFEVNKKVPDKALEQLSKLRPFAEDENIAIYPLGEGGAIAIFVVEEGWIRSSKGYHCYIYDGNSWSAPQRICDVPRGEEISFYSKLSIGFVANKNKEAYFFYRDVDNDEMTVCHFKNQQWNSPHKVPLGRLILDANGTAFVSTNKGKIFRLHEGGYSPEICENLNDTTYWVRDREGTLSFLGLITSSEGKESLLEFIWDGQKWQSTLLYAIGDSDNVWAKLKNIRGGKLAFWQVEKDNQISLYSALKTASGWSEPELIDIRPLQRVQSLKCSRLWDSVRILTVGDTALLIWLKDGFLTSRLWRDGHWEETQTIGSDPQYFLSCDSAENKQGQVCLFWVTTAYPKLGRQGKASIWTNGKWSDPQVVLRSNNLDDAVPPSSTAVGIDEQGNALVAWHNKVLFEDYELDYSLYTNNKWNTTEEIENTAIPFIYNYKGKLVFSYVQTKGECEFRVVKDGVLSAPFKANAKQDLINQLLGVPSP